MNWRRLLLPNDQCAPGSLVSASLEIVWTIRACNPHSPNGTRHCTPRSALPRSLQSLVVRQQSLIPRTIFGLVVVVGLMLTGCRENLTPGLGTQTGFTAVVFFTRAAPNKSGSLVVADEFRPGGNVWLLSPASPGGDLTNLTKMSAGDVQGIDLSPDAKRLVAALRTDRADSFHLVIIDLEKVAAESCFTSSGDLGPACQQLTFGPANDTKPFYMQDGRIAFLRADPDGPVDPLGRDRAQILMAVDADASTLERIDYGTGHALGASALRTGLVHVVRWTLRQGQPVFMPMLVDPTGARGESVDGPPADTGGVPLMVNEDQQGRQVAVCVPKNGTWDAGALCQSQGYGQWQSMVVDIPLSQGCSPAGRLHDALPLSDGRYLVSYAQTPGGCLDASDELPGLVPDFGLAILDPDSAERTLLHNFRGLSDISPRPVMARSLLNSNVELPTRPDIGCQEDTVVFEGIIEQQKLVDGAVRLRVLEGISGAFAPWAMDLFGSDAGAICGGYNDLGAGPVAGFEAPVYSDGSFRFSAPASVPMRIQLLDVYGAAMATDPVWRGGPPCARRRCDGCHKNEGDPVGFDTSQATTRPLFSLGGPATMRTSFDFRRDIQEKILEVSCVGCHGSSNPAGSYVDLNLGLHGVRLSNQPLGQTSMAYQDLLFYDVRRDSSGAVLESRWAFVKPGNARESDLVKRLGAPRQFDDLFPPVTSWAPGDDQHRNMLSKEDMYSIIQWIDAGAPFYGRGSTP
jgi:hypothetical protein